MATPGAKLIARLDASTCSLKIKRTLTEDCTGLGGRKTVLDVHELNNEAGSYKPQEVADRYERCVEEAREAADMIFTKHGFVNTFKWTDSPDISQTSSGGL